MIRIDDKNYPTERRRKIGNEKMLKRQRQKALSVVVLIGCSFLVVNFYTSMKPYIGNLLICAQQTHLCESRYMSKASSTRLEDGELKKNNITSIFSNYRTDVYQLQGHIRIHGLSSTIFIPLNNPIPNLNYIKPHPRNENLRAMDKVTPFKIETDPDQNTPPCTRYHVDTPAVLFSAGGFTGNHFHAIADVIVPLFLTTHHFNRSVLFLVSSYDVAWISKYRVIMDKLSEYDMYDVDKENQVLCFSRLIVGLKAYRDLEILPSRNFSRRNFTDLLRLDFLRGRHARPRMLIVSRKGGRRLLNDVEVGEMAEKLGFDAVVREFPWNFSSMAKTVNSFDVMVGVHGAGLANSVFLREGGVLVQIVPFGLHLLAKICFEGCLESNGLKYLRYDVGLNESSLWGKYPSNSKIYTSPLAISKNFDVFKEVYLENQDVSVDLSRFRETLLRAMHLLLA